MLYPSINSLLKKADSRYTLVVVAAKRARALTEKDASRADGKMRKPVINALMEIAQDKISYKRTRIGIK